jgi:ubiquinone/menaquinone biosynthesis C-methylase UbiE
MKHRHVPLVAALIVWIFSMTAVAVYFLGRKWFWFGAGTAATVLAVHIALHWIAVALGGASIVSYAHGWLRGESSDNGKPAPETTGRVIHWAFRYDLMLWFLSFGRERAMRERQIALANLKLGESVLDVGCGTGTLTMAAKRHVGPEGKVYGIDASPEMIARARKKASRANLEIAFDTAAIESMAFPDASFDVVVSSAMLHHLPDETRRKGLQEVRRVLKPGGRMLAIDFAGGESERRHLIGQHRNHAHFSIQQVIPELSEAGLGDISSGKVGVLDLWFVRSTAPAQ